MRTLMPMPGMSDAARLAAQGLSKGAGVAKTAANSAHGAAASAASKGGDMSEKMMASAMAQWEEMPTHKEFAKARLLDAAGPARHQLLMSARDVVKASATSDPDMWPCVRPAIRAAVDTAFNDLEQDLEGKLQDAILKKHEDDDTEGPECCGALCCLCCAVRAFILHHMYPHDKSFFGQSKDCVFLAITALTMVPVHGIRVLVFTVFLIMHLCPGPADEFQLINFILTFKGMQFITGGIVAMCMGSMQYFRCYSAAGRDGDKLLECIETSGPGAFESLFGELLDYIGCIVIVWIAFLALPCSKKYAETLYVGRAPPVEQEETVCFCCTGVRTRGGRLRSLLCVDVLAFIASLFFLAVITFLSCTDEVAELQKVSTNLTAANTTATDVGSQTSASMLTLLEHPQFKANVFWSKCVYALLSFPFLVFKVPVISSILTHSKATGYNEHGACVPFAIDPQAEHEEGESGSEDADE
eukprot:TRINITY_DN21793_c0_g1_i1.p1 TRINITY_DN21793_c0_g1~~TRINITY_DN21793_c0_g1_i1.p1  ORF type:complete len:471 (+),score=85.66 TRINITY_DN21793_c0_g1_i1:41-1453(+)